jgi:hypothetical protein
VCLFVCRGVSPSWSALVNLYMARCTSTIYAYKYLSMSGVAEHSHFGMAMRLISGLRSCDRTDENNENSWWRWCN